MPMTMRAGIVRRHVEDQQRRDFLVRQVERGADRRHQRRMIEPDQEAHEKCEPGQVQHLDPRLETKKIEAALRLVGHARTVAMVGEIKEWAARRCAGWRL
jgi:hypothetical protein